VPKLTSIHFGWNQLIRIQRRIRYGAYLDDLRMYPVDGTMKSFVYDDTYQRLQAELDENNYATFYDYDHEGNLIRVRKETERGILTLQESYKHTHHPNP
jgi:hypothetical protein